MVERFSIRTEGQSLYEITDRVLTIVHRESISQGLCTVFVQHTSASLVIQENADPSARRDLVAWLNKTVIEGDKIFTHTTEGPDDMPAHIKAALTNSSLSVPIIDGTLALGTWQGIFLWEHRRLPHDRSIVVHVGR